MAAKRQFSLAYLFLETFWIALALGIAVQARQIPRESVLLPCLVYLDILLWGAAIGGLFKKMRVGAIVSAIVLLIFGAAAALQLVPS